MQTEVARDALRALNERRGNVDPHDPELLYCLDKVDVISRYQLLLNQFEAYKRDTAEHHEADMYRLKKAVAQSARWWTHCLRLRQQKRKTAQLADMFPEGETE
jgi:hypothetical protein